MKRSWLSVLNSMRPSGARNKSYLARNSLEVRRLLACLPSAMDRKSSGKCGQPHYGQKYPEEFAASMHKKCTFGTRPPAFFVQHEEAHCISFDTYIVNLGMKPCQIHQKSAFPYQPLYESDYCFLKNHAIFLLIQQAPLCNKAVVDDFTGARDISKSHVNLLIKT